MHKEKLLEPKQVFGIIALTLVAILLEAAVFTAPTIAFSGALFATAFVVAGWVLILSIIMGWIE